MVDPGIYAILFNNMAGSLAIFTVLPMLPFLAMRMGATAFEVSVLGPAFYVAQMFCCAVVGTLSDRVGRKRVLVMASLFQAVSNVLLARVSSVTTLLLANLGRGAALSVQPVEMAYIMESADNEDQLGRILVLQRFALSFGALGGPMVGRILSHHSFEFLCKGLVLMNLLCTLNYMLMLRDAKPTVESGSVPGSVPGSRLASADVTPNSIRSMPRTPRGSSIVDSLARVFRNTSRAALLGCWFASSFSGGVCDGPEMVLFKDHFGFTVKQSCDFFMIGTLSSIIGTSLVHPMIMGIGDFPGFGPHAVCVAGAVGCSLSTFGLVALSGVSWLPYLYAVCMSGISGSMFSLGFMHILQKRCSKATLGSFLGLVQALGSAGVTLGPPIGGTAYGINNFAPPMITTVLYMITAVLFAYLLAEPTLEKASTLAPPTTLAALPEEEEEDEVIYIPTLLSQPVMFDKNFATRIVVNEVSQDMDPDLMAAYQAYKQQLGDEHGIRCFSVAGDRLVDTALRGMRMDYVSDQVKLRRAQTDAVGVHFHMNEDEETPLKSS